MAKKKDPGLTEAQKFSGAFEKAPRYYVMKGDQQVAAYNKPEDAFKHRDKLGKGHSVVRTAIKTFKVKTHQWDHPEVEE